MRAPEEPGKQRQEACDFVVSCHNRVFANLPEPPLGQPAFLRPGTGDIAVPSELASRPSTRTVARRDQIFQPDLATRRERNAIDDGIGTSLRPQQLSETSGRGMGPQVPPPPDTLEARTNATASDDLPERLAVEMMARTSFKSAYALIRDSSRLVREGQEYARRRQDELERARLQAGSEQTSTERKT